MESLKDLEIVRLKPEKDDSDTQSAVNHMIREGSKRNPDLWCHRNKARSCDWPILDYFAMGKEQGVQIVLADQWNYITLVESGTVLKKEEQFGKYVSFFSVGGDVAGLYPERI